MCTSLSPTPAQVDFKENYNFLMKQFIFNRLLTLNVSYGAGSGGTLYCLNWLKIIIK